MNGMETHRPNQTVLQFQLLGVLRAISGVLSPDPEVHLEIGDYRLNRHLPELWLVVDSACVMQR